MVYGSLLLAHRRAQERRAVLEAARRAKKLAVDNDGSHTSKRVEQYVENCGGQLSLHPLPAWGPQSNPVDLIWWSSLHEAV
jgi:hypothetical protein